MKKVKKSIKVPAILNILLVPIAFLIAYALKGAPFISNFKRAKNNKWYKIKMGKSVVSSDGSRYFLFAKKGVSNNLMIYFSGGGLDFDFKTASEPMSIKTVLSGKGMGYYFSNIPFYKLFLMNGILQENNTENGFNDWNIVYIPYSTGDFHVGSNVKLYKEGEQQVKVRHNGSTNAQTALDWVFENISLPEKILVTGESAGGFGAAFWLQKIANHYSNSKIYEYSDSSYLNSDRWTEILDKEWNADFQNRFGFAPEDDLLGAAFKENSKKLPDTVTLLQSNTLTDHVLIKFQSLLNGKTLNRTARQQWTKQMVNSMGYLDKKLKNYYFYLSDQGYDKKECGTPHTISHSSEFYTSAEEGITLNKWLSDCVIRDNCYSVGGKFINAESKSISDLQEDSEL
ncbi:MAG TPA: pectin acetylesterase-family hydrolase [Ruminiclostridium sp.]